MNIALSQSIIRTLAFFDICSQPLTREELYRLLWTDGKEYDYEDMMNTLDHMCMMGDVMYYEGYICLAGRQNIIAMRTERIYDIEKKLSIAHRASRIMRCVPFVRAVFVCNSLGFGTADEESDIDVLVIARHGHVWAVRFLLHIILKLFFLRTSGHHLKNKICLSFILSDARLNMYSLRFGERDVYQVYWLLHLIPLYDPDNMHSSIMRANMWLRDVVSGVKKYDYQSSHRLRVIDTSFNLRMRILLSSWFISSRMEQWCKKIQFPRLNTVYGDVASYPDTRVIISDDMVKLHKNDRRQWFLTEWNNIISNVY